MKIFVVRGVGSDGRERAFWVDGEDAFDALRAAGEMGYADAALVSDGETPPVNGRRPYPAWLYARVVGAPNRFARFRALLLMVYMKAWAFLGVVTVGAWGWSAYTGSAVPLVMWGMMVVVGPAALANKIAGGRTVLARVHEKLLGGRRDEALRLIPKLRRELRPMGQVRVDFMAAGIEAGVMAFRGEVEEALDLVRSFEGVEGVSEMEVLDRELSVWQAADEPEEVLRVAWRMTEAEPMNPGAWCTLAAAAGVVYADAALGRWALDRAAGLPISEAMRDATHIAEGAVRIAEGRQRDAVGSLQTAQAWLDRVRGLTPLVGSAEYEIGALRAIAHARLGEMDRARRWFASCERYLHAHRRTMLRERCLAALEGRPEPFGRAPDVSSDVGYPGTLDGVGSGT